MTKDIRIITKKDGDRRVTVGIIKPSAFTEAMNTPLNQNRGQVTDPKDTKWIDKMDKEKT